MYTKIINPETHGKNVYDNRGSVARTLNYLVNEAKKDGQKATFFSAEQDHLTAVEVKQNIDSNVKGLRKDEAKFYSIVLSPSTEELAHISNDLVKLKAYARERMQQYAENYRLKGGIKLNSKDLVWGATVHNERTYRGSDQEVREGRAKAGDKREGLQTHIHIVVSARDAKQKITLNPQGSKKRFPMIEWQEQGVDQYTKQFGAVGIKEYPNHQHSPTIIEMRRGIKEAIQEAQQRRQQERRQNEATQQRRNSRIRDRVGVINNKRGPDAQLDAERIITLGHQRNYDKVFYAGLKRIEERVERGAPTDNAYVLLATGRESESVDRIAGTIVQVMRQLAQAGREVQRHRTQKIGEQDHRNEGEIEIY